MLCFAWALSYPGADPEYSNECEPVESRGISGILPANADTLPVVIIRPCYLWLIAVARITQRRLYLSHRCS